MSTPATCRARAIKDLAFTDEHVWIHGKVVDRAGDRILVDDGTGQLEINTTNDPDGEGSCVLKGPISVGSLVRVIGEVISDTSKHFKVKPSVVIDIGSMGATMDMLDKTRAAEERVRGEP